MMYNECVYQKINVFLVLAKNVPCKQYEELLWTITSIKPKLRLIEIIKSTHLSNGQQGGYSLLLHSHRFKCLDV